jgi:hypothetical protein
MVKKYEDEDAVIEEMMLMDKSLELFEQLLKRHYEH